MQEGCKRSYDLDIVSLVETYLLWARAEAEVRHHPANDVVSRLVSEALTALERIRTTPLVNATRGRIASFTSEFSLENDGQEASGHAPGHPIDSPPESSSGACEE